jgi:hypothetical protein
MSKHVISCVPALCAGLLATVIMLESDFATLAADDCLAGPNRPPHRQGGHWYYRVDHAANRKCWYLVEPAARGPAADAPEPQPASEAAPQLTFGSIFSAFAAGFPRATAGAQPDPTTGDARITQTARPDDPRNDAIAPGRSPRIARRPDAVAALVPKPRRPAHARPPAEHADEQAVPPAQAERDALFQEFLKWRQRQ